MRKAGVVLMKIRVLISSLVLLILIGIGGGYYYFIQHNHSTTNERHDPSTTAHFKRRLQMKKIPNSYRNRTTVAERGRVEKLTYQTKYNKQIFTKTALVYLPVGYEQNSDKRYNIVYLLHGSTMSETSFLGGVGTNQNTPFKKLLDHEMADKKMKPTIVVTPMYYPDRSYVSNSYYDDNKLNLAFATSELPNDLIPTIEARYRTYAKSTDMTGLSRSRNHRAFAGFSMGSITAWYVFEHQLNLFKYFMPMAGDSWTITTDGGASQPDQTATKLADQVKKTVYRPSDYLILASVGGNDGTSGSMTPMIKSMRQHSQQFTDRNLLYSFDAGGGHDILSVVNQSYNSFSQLFKK